MFRNASPPDPDVTSLRALHLSLNAPVVAIGDLPAEPARAVIAVLQGRDGSPWIAVALRSNPGREVLFYSAEGAPDAGGSLDAALCFAGAMGFLFDEDEPEPAGEAAGLWDEWLGREAPRPATASGPEAGEPSRPLPAVSRALPLTKFRRLSGSAQHQESGRQIP